MQNSTDGGTRRPDTHTHTHTPERLSWTAITNLRSTRRAAAESRLCNARPDDDDADWVNNAGEADGSFRSDSRARSDTVGFRRSVVRIAHDVAGEDDREIREIHVVTSPRSGDERSREAQDILDGWLDYEYDSDAENMELWPPERDAPAHVVNPQELASMRGHMSENVFTAGRSYLFHVPGPPPVCVLAVDEFNEDGARSLRRTRNIQDAEANVMAAKMSRAAELQHEKEKSRILMHDPGWSGIGRVSALNAHVDRPIVETEGLGFYLGPDTRLSM